MESAAVVLACALELLGPSARTLPPIELVPQPPRYLSLRTNGYVRAGIPTIYLITTSPVFRDAQCGNRRSLIMLAGVIMHEEWHVRNGGAERGAYEAHLYTLLRLGVTPDSMEYRTVRRSMDAALRNRARDGITDPPEIAAGPPS